MLDKRLTRNTEDKMLAGVCGGLAKYIGIDPTLIRLAFVAATLLAGWGPIVYGIMWLIVPEDQDVKRKRVAGDSDAYMPTSDSYKVRVQIDGEEE